MGTKADRTDQAMPAGGAPIAWKGWRKAMAKFRLQRLRDGRKHVLVTDSPADYLRCLIDEMAGNFNVLCHVTVTEKPPAAARAEAIGHEAAQHAEGDWMRVEIESAAEAVLLDRASEFRFGEFADELNHIFVKFYDRDGDAAASLDGTTFRNWTVRHRRGCPWI